ncbi:MAG: hypothetical protein AAB425_02270 [Bdellovibrionota bacterium]
MKNKIVALVLSISILLLPVSRPASAALVGASGAAIGATVAAGAAVGIFGLPVLATITDKGSDFGTNMGWWALIIIFTSGLAFAPFLIPGVILADTDSAHQEMRFSELSEGDATGLSITAEERTAYNDEIDSIRLIHETVTSEILARTETSADDAGALWEEYRSELSADAYAALTKVSAGLRTQVTAP